MKQDKIRKYFILSHAWENKLLQQQTGGITVTATTLFTEEQDMYQNDTDGNASHYLNAVKSKLQAQKSNKDTKCV